jgi:hypothetical protein
VLSDLKELEIRKRGSIALEMIDTELSEYAAQAVEQAKGAPADAVVCEEVESRTNEQVQLSGVYLMFMVLVRAKRASHDHCARRPLRDETRKSLPTLNRLSESARGATAPLRPAAHARARSPPPARLATAPRPARPGQRPLALARSRRTRRKHGLTVRDRGRVVGRRRGRYGRVVHREPGRRHDCPGGASRGARFRCRAPVPRRARGCESATPRA